MLHGVWRIVLLVSVLLLFSGLFGICIADNSNVETIKYEISPMNPDYLAYKELATTTSLDINKNYMTGFVPPECRISDPTEGMQVRASALQYPSSYDLRSLDRVTSVKDQNPWGTCWAFAAMSSLESNLMPYENLNFSEKNMVNRNLRGTTPDSGGNYYNSGGYFVAQLGPVSEQNDPYPSGTWNYTSPSGPVEKNVYQINWLPDRSSSTDLDAIKDSVINDGALSTTYYENYGWNSTYNSYYYPTDTSINHAVTIVGWNDNFSRSNFTSTPPGDGAFLIKNSWGSSWGDGGYGWISYYDANIGKNSAMFYASNISQYDEIYQHDLAGPTASFTLDDSLVSWGASCYNVTKSGYLNAIGFYTTDNPTSYEIIVYYNLTSTPISGDEKYSCNGTYDSAGYHVINLTTPVKLTKDDRFSIVTHLVNTDYKYSLPIQYLPYTRGYNPTIYDGDGYYSANGLSWNDARLINNDNSTTCIKGYVCYSAPGPEITDFTPKTGNNSSTSFAMNVTGSNIQDGAILKLVNTVSGQSINNNTPTMVSNDGRNLGTTFNLSGHVAGTYLVNLTNPDGGSVASDTQFVLTSVLDDIFTIQASAETGGVISPSGIVQVVKGNNQTFSISPNKGYSIKDVIIDNSSGGTITAYTFSNVSTNHTIYALFSWVPDSYMINSSSNQWSKIIPSGNNSYPVSSNQSFFMQAIPGSTLTNVSVDDVLHEYPVDNWTFTNLTKDYAIHINGTPIPGQVQVFFNASPRYGQAPLTVHFSDQSIGSPTSYFWQFGDGTTNTTQSPNHTYTIPGTYSVILRAANNRSGGDGQWNNFITVTKDNVPEPTPTPIPGDIVASFDVEPVYGSAPLSVECTDNSSGNPVSWFWDFGDGNTSSQQNATHTYTNPGLYSISLIAKNVKNSGTITRSDVVLVN